jgi:hypothetical protein
MKTNRNLSQNITVLIIGLSLGIVCTHLYIKINVSEAINWGELLSSDVRQMMEQENINWLTRARAISLPGRHTLIWDPQTSNLVLFLATEDREHVKNMFVADYEFNHFRVYWNNNTNSTLVRPQRVSAGLLQRRDGKVMAGVSYGNTSYWGLSPDGQWDFKRSGTNMYRNLKGIWQCVEEN